MNRAIEIKTFEGLRKVFKKFAVGKIPALMVLGPPGQCKTETLREAMGKKPYLLLRGKTTPISLYEQLYEHRDLPVVLDDTPQMLLHNDVQEMLRDLTETTESRRISWRTQSRILDDRDLPRQFHTASPVCLVANRIGSGGVWDALESRCLQWKTNFSWPEVCNEVKRAGWFRDREILQYAETQAVCEPDVRLFHKAARLKNCRLGDWRQLFSRIAHRQVGSAVVADLLKDSSLSTRDRVARFASEGCGSRATYYRRQAKLRAGSLTEIPHASVPAKTNKKISRGRASRGRKAVGTGRRNLTRAANTLRGLGGKRTARKRGAA